MRAFGLPPNAVLPLHLWAAFKQVEYLLLSGRCACCARFTVLLGFSFSAARLRRCNNGFNTSPQLIITCAASTGWRRMQPKTKGGRSHITLRTRSEQGDDHLMSLEDTSRDTAAHVLEQRAPGLWLRESKWLTGLPEARGEASTSEAAPRSLVLTRGSSQGNLICSSENV